MKHNKVFFDGDTPKWKEFTINANKEYKYIRYAVSKAMENTAQAIYAI